jgi:hypothetical protein
MVYLFNFKMRVTMKASILFSLLLSSVVVNAAETTAKPEVLIPQTVQDCTARNIGNDVYEFSVWCNGLGEALAAFLGKHPELEFVAFNGGHGAYFLVVMRPKK